MFCSRAFAFMALILKTRILCKMHNTKKYMLATQTKKMWKKKQQKYRKIWQHNRTMSIFSDFIFVILHFFCLCCQHKFKIFMYLVFKFPNNSLKNIQRKCHKSTKNQHRMGGKKYRNQEKDILHQSTSLPSPWKRRVFSVSPRHKNSKKIWRHQGFRPPLPLVIDRHQSPKPPPSLMTQYVDVPSYVKK